MSRLKNKAKLFRGLSDPARLLVLETLRSGPRCVSDLLETTRLLQPNLSMHLACLRDCGLVRAQRNGRFVYYELADGAVAKLLNSGEQVLARVAAQIEACTRYELNTKPKRLRARRILQ